MKKLSIILLTLVLLVISSVSIGAEELAFNPKVDIQPGTDITTVIVDGESDDAFKEVKPQLSVEVSYSSCYVTLNGNVVNSTLKDGVVTFTVASAGTYEIVKGTYSSGSGSTNTTTPTPTPTPTVVPTKTPVATTPVVKNEIPDNASIKVEEQNNEYNLEVVEISIDEIKDSLTEEEIEAIKNGAEIAITVEVKEVEITKKEESAISQVIGDTGTVCMYLDIQIMKQIGDLDKTAVTSTSKEIALVIEIPKEIIIEDSEYERVYYLVRVHNGVATRIDGEFNPKDGTLSFSSDKFSTYALVYEDKPKEKTEETIVIEDNNHKTSVIPYVCGGLAVAIVITLVVINKKKK